MTNLYKAQLAVGGTSLAGFPIGVLHLASTYPLLPGNAQHAASYPGPVLFEEVPIDDVWALMNGEDAVGEAMVKAAKRLQDRGVRAIVGACGSFAYYQKQAAASLDVPIFTSVLTQVPFLLSALGKNRLGIICASESSMNARIYEQCAIDHPERLVIRQMKGTAQFDKMLTGVEPLDPKQFEQETTEVAMQLAREAGDLGAILLQCSDLPPFAHAIQTATGLCVFDAVTLARSVMSSAGYAPYKGAYRTQVLS